MGKYFGTDGFRGEVNVELTAWHAYEIGRFLGRYYTEKSAAAARRTAGGEEEWLSAKTPAVPPICTNTR